MKFKARVVLFPFFLVALLTGFYIVLSSSSLTLTSHDGTPINSNSNPIASWRASRPVEWKAVYDKNLWNKPNIFDMLNKEFNGGAFKDVSSLKPSQEKDVIKLYEDRYERTAPQAMEKWLQLSNKLGCIENFYYYDQVIRDLYASNVFQSTTFNSREGGEGGGSELREAPGTLEDSLPPTDVVWGFIDKPKWRPERLFFKKGTMSPQRSRFPYFNVLLGLRPSKFGLFWNGVMKYFFTSPPSSFLLFRDLTVADEWPTTLLENNFAVEVNMLDAALLISTPLSEKAFAQDNLLMKDLDNPCLNRYVIPDSAFYGGNAMFVSQRFPYTDQTTPRVLITESKGPCMNDLLLPLTYHLDLSHKIIKDHHKFTDKKPGLFWRGSNTGGQWKKDNNWSGFGRNLALKWEKEFAIKNPKSVFTHGAFDKVGADYKVGNYVPVDIGLTSVIQCDPEVCDTLLKLYKTKPSVSFEETISYKYLLVLDGNAWPSRLQTYLQLNSVILYHQQFISYYTWILEPWVHYVPVSLDLSDLQQRLMWLEENPEKALKIIANAQAVVRIFNRREQMQCHTSFALMHLDDANK